MHLRVRLMPWIGALTATFAAVALAGASAAHGAGMTTHAWMAEEGVGHVQTPELKALLEAQSVMVMSGAQFPDSGYAPGTGYGETAHWEDFTDAYAAHIRSKPECVDTLDDPLGPCAPLVAHLMGAAAHGMGDEMWDWLFEPTMADHGENPDSKVRSRVDDQPGFAELGTLPMGENLQHALIEAEHGAMDNPFGDLIGSSEYAMDVVAINDHGRYLHSPAPPPVEDVVAVYNSMGLYTGEDGQMQLRAMLLGGHAFINAALVGERLSIVEAQSVRNDFPYSAAHMHDDPGGVEHTAVAIAGYYESVWAKLHGENPPPHVVQVAPLPGSTSVPARWQPAKTQPGPYPDRGGARNRIFAALSNAVDESSLTPESFRLLDSDGERVPSLPGFPKAGPYGGGSGTHSMLFYPAGNLEPCELYSAEVTTDLRNRRGRSAIAPYSWSFKTESADGSACPPPPDPDPDPDPEGDPSPAPGGDAGAEGGETALPAPVPTAGDRQAPVIGLDLGRRQTVRKIVRGLRFGWWCDEACSARFTLRLGREVLDRQSRSAGEGTRIARLEPCAGRRGGGCARRLARELRRGKARPLVVEVEAVDVAGNRGRITRELSAGSQN